MCRQGITQDETVYRLRGPLGIRSPLKTYCARCGQIMFRPGSWGAPTVTRTTCAGCVRPLVHEVSDSPRSQERSRFFCCADHRQVFYSRLHAERRKAERAAAREKDCEHCHESFEATRRDARYCGDTCRQRAHRQRQKER